MLVEPKAWQRAGGMRRMSCIMIYNSMLVNFKNLLKEGLILFSREEANSCLGLRAKVRSPLPLCSVSLTLTLSCSAHSHKAGGPAQRLSRHLCHTLGLLSHQTFLASAL